LIENAAIMKVCGL